MISAVAMCLAASAAKRIISTAPIAKLGATIALAAGRPSRGASLPQRRRVKARGADHHVHAGAQAGQRVAEGGVRAA